MAWLRFSAFFQMMALSIANLIPLAWSQGMHFNSEQIGFLVGIANIISIVAPFVFGYKGGQNPALWIILCFSGMALTCLTQSFFPYFAVQMLLFSAYIFLRSGILTLVPVGVMSHLKENPGQEYGRYRRVGSIGFLVGSIGVGYMMDFLNPLSLFWILSAACFIALIPYLKKIKIPQSGQKSTFAIRTLFKNKLLCYFWPATFLISTWSGAVFVFMPLRIHEMGYSSSFASWVQSLCGFTALATLSLAGKLTDKYPLYKLYYFVPIFAFLRIFCMALPSQNAEWFLLIQLFHIPTWVLGEVIQVRFLKDFSPKDLWPQSQALYQSISALGMAMAGVIGGSISYRLNMPLAFILLSFIPLFAYPFLHFMRKNHQNHNQAL